MRDCLFRNGLIVGIIVLFIGLSITPSMSIDVKSRDMEDKEMDATVKWYVRSAPGAQFKWIDDDGAMSNNNTDGELPKIPDDTDAPINIQFQIIGDDHTYYGATSQQEAMENITLTGNALFTGTLNKIPGVSFSGTTWTVPVIPTMSQGGGNIEIYATWTGYGDIIETLSIGGTNYMTNGTIVTVTPQEFKIGTNQTFTVEVKYADGTTVSTASVYLYYIDDGEVATAGDPIETHTISSDTYGFNGYSLGFNTTQQRDNQTEAGFGTIKAPRNLSVYATTYIGGTLVYGWALVKMKPANNLKVTIKRGLGRSIRVDIENIESGIISDITWNIIVTRRGLFKKTILNIAGNISTLEEGLTETVFGRPFGFGFIKVTVNVTALGMDPIDKTVMGFVFLRFVRLRRFL